MKDLYPPPAFHFRVAISSGSEDTSFQEVSGISVQMETEEYVEGGENRFVHRLPKGVKHANLVLKRGVAEADSPLVEWCRDVLEGGLGRAIEPRGVMVVLLDGEREPLRSWSFDGAYPVKWDVDAFNSTKNEVAIETIELAFTTANRVK